MNALCILNKLFIPGVGSFKEDLYPQAIRAHALIFEHVTLHVLGTRSRSKDDAHKLSEFCKEQSLGRSDAAVPSIKASYVAAYLLFRSFIRYPSKYWFGFIRNYFFDLKLVLAHFENSATQPDIVCGLTSTYHSGIFAKIVAEHYNVPFVIWEHQSHFRDANSRLMQKRLLRSTIDAAGLFIPVSDALARTILEALGCCNENFRIIGNPAPPFFFEDEIKRPSCSEFLEGRFVFAAWAAWRKIKRLNLLLSAFKRFQKEHPNSCLVVAGSIERDIYSALELKGMEGFVLLTGPLGRDEIRALASSAHCCVITSDYETFGLPAIESLAVGRPVISTRCGGPESLLKDESLGRLVEPSNVDALASAMRDVYLNYSKFNRSAIQAYAESNFSSERFLAKWESVYRELLKEACPNKEELHEQGSGHSEEQH